MENTKWVRERERVRERKHWIKCFGQLNVAKALSNQIDENSMAAQTTISEMKDKQIQKQLFKHGICGTHSSIRNEFDSQ